MTTSVSSPSSSVSESEEEEEEGGGGVFGRQGVPRVVSAAG